MTTRDDNNHSADRNNPPAFFEKAWKEVKTIYSSPANKRLSKDLILEAIKAAPLVGGAVSFTEKFMQGIAGIEREVRLERLEKYFQGLCRDYDEDTELLDEDLLPVIKKLATDDENSKTEYYIRLTLKLARMDLSEMPVDLRYHFIRLVSSLTFYQIAFARELKIRKTIPVRDTASFEEAELALTGQDSGMVMQAVRALQNAGLLKEKTYPPREQKPERILYDTTSDFTTLMELLFHKTDFEPETVGLQRKEESDIILVGKPCFIDNLYETYLLAGLHKAGLKAKFVESNDKHLTTDWAPLYLQTGIEGSGYDEKIKLYLTQEGTPHWKTKGENYLHCWFETRVYIREKSSSPREAKYFREQMDQVVNSILRKLNNLEPHT